MIIFVDADSCPKSIKEILYKSALRTKIQTKFIANQYLNVPLSEYINTVIVSEGQNMADDKIVEMVQPGDLVITADIPLADRIVDKKALALNPRGTLYSKENIKYILSNRNFMTELRNNGIETGGPAPFTQKDVHQFANQLDRLLTKLKTK